VDCCSGRCMNAPTGGAICNLPKGCRADLELCAKPEDCCSGLCAPTAAGVQRCRPLSGCRPTGDLCLNDDDCCAHHCMATPDGAGTCAPQMGCRPLGDKCAKPDDCCAAGKDGCRMDSEGTLRCLGPTGPGAACTRAGYPCAVSEQCCDGGRCLPDARGGYACRSGCAPLGAGCSADGDCCAGLCVGAPGQMACVTLDGPDAGPVCTFAGAPCDPDQATCCRGTTCAVVAGGGHACAAI
jgi:hypothetical protein